MTQSVSNLLHELVTNTAESMPDQQACVQGTQSLSYGELAALIRRCAAGISALGCRRFDRVAVYLPKRIETVVSIFAASRAGCVMVPVNPILKPSQVLHIVDNCKAKLLITSKSRFATLSPHILTDTSITHVVLIDDFSDMHANVEMMQWHDLLAAGIGNETGREKVLAGDMASILYTSGSTGRPKGVVLSHQNLVVGAQSVAEYLANSPQDRILSLLPLSFDAGLSQLTTGFSAGATVVLLDFLMPGDVVKTCERERITGMTGVPPLWIQLTSVDWPDSATANMRYFANTGGKMPGKTLGELRQLFPAAEPFLMYGLTEAFRSTYLAPEEVDRRPDSIGKAIPNAEVSVLRQDGSETDPSEPGELVHRGPLVAMGYWDDKERTAERFKPVPFRPKEIPGSELAVWSGDTVVRDEDGFLYFVGRKDDMIKTSGYRISPTEIEEAAFASGLVEEVAAVGAEHPKLGQAAVLFAVAIDKNEDGAGLLTHLRAALPAYMIPQDILWRDRFDKNPNGKTDRNKLREEIKDRFTGDEV